MKYIFLFALVTYIADAQVTILKDFSWNTECGYGDPIIVLNLTVTPDPIEMPGKVTVNALVDSTEDIVDAPGTFFDILLQRKIYDDYVEQPCVDSLSIGSCSFDLCPTLENRHPDGCTQQQIDSGIPCLCKDMVAGKYSIQDFVLILASQPPGVLFDGDYQAHVTLTSDHQLMCLDVYFSVAVDLHA